MHRAVADGWLESQLESQWRDGKKSTTRIMLAGMEHRGIEYTVVQGIERGTWVWTVSLGNNTSKSGKSAGRSEAKARAMQLINKALAVRKVQLIPTGSSPNDEP